MVRLLRAPTGRTTGQLDVLPAGAGRPPSLSGERRDVHDDAAVARPAGDVGAPHPTQRAVGLRRVIGNRMCRVPLLRHTFTHVAVPLPVVDVHPPGAVPRVA